MSRQAWQGAITDRRWPPSTRNSSMTGGSTSRTEFGLRGSPFRQSANRTTSDRDRSTPKIARASREMRCLLDLHIIIVTTQGGKMGVVTGRQQVGGILRDLPITYVDILPRICRIVHPWQIVVAAFITIGSSANSKDASICTG